MHGPEEIALPDTPVMAHIDVDIGSDGSSLAAMTPTGATVEKCLKSEDDGDHSTASDKASVEVKIEDDISTGSDLDVEAEDEAEHAGLEMDGPTQKAAKHVEHDEKTDVKVKAEAEAEKEGGSISSFENASSHSSDSDNEEPVKVDEPVKVTDLHSHPDMTLVVKGWDLWEVPEDKEGLDELPESAWLVEHFGIVGGNLGSSSPFWSHVVYQTEESAREAALAAARNAAEYRQDGLLSKYVIRDANPKAFKVYLDIVHYNFEKVPEKVDVLTLYNVAVIGNRFSWIKMIRPWANKWLKDNFLAAFRPNKGSGDEVAMMTVAYHLGNKQVFGEMSLQLVENGCMRFDGDWPVLVSGDRRVKEDQLPIGIHDWIMEVRSKMLADAFAVVMQEFNKLMSLRHDPSIKVCNSSDPKQKRACESLILGSLLQEMGGIELWPIPDEGTWGGSIAKLADWMKNLKVDRYPEDNVAPHLREHTCCGMSLKCMAEVFRKRAWLPAQFVDEMAENAKKTGCGGDVLQLSEQVKLGMSGEMRQGPMGHLVMPMSAIAHDQDLGTPATEAGSDGLASHKE